MKKKKKWNGEGEGQDAHGRQKNGEKRKKWRDRWMDVVTENGEVKEGG